MILPTKFQVNWLFSSGADGQNRFQVGSSYLKISDRNDFSFFDLQVALIFPTKF